MTSPDPIHPASGDMEAARDWLRKRWSQDHPNEGHVKQLAAYAAHLAALRPDHMGEADTMMPANPPATAAGVGEAVVLYIPMPVTKDGRGPADESDTHRIEHQVWDAETNGTLATAADEAVARHIVSLWNTTPASHDALIARVRGVLTDLLFEDSDKSPSDCIATRLKARALLNHLDARDGG